MQTSTQIRITTYIHLEKDEMFTGVTKDGNAFRFMIRRIAWRGSDAVTLTGPALKTNGELSVAIDRSSWEKFENLNADLQDRLKLSRRLAIAGLLDQESEVGRPVL